MSLLALFCFLGLVIAAVGIHGVMTCMVAQPTNGIGRACVGAIQGNVVSLVLRRAADLGVVIGSPATGT